MASLKYVKDSVLARGSDVVTAIVVVETEDSRSTPLPEVESLNLVLQKGMCLYPFGIITIDDLCLASAVRNRLIVQETQGTVSYATSQVLNIEIDALGQVFVQTQNVRYLARTKPRTRGLFNFLRG